MFPKKNMRLSDVFGTTPHIASHVDDKTGIVVEEMVECNRKLPDAAMFKIANQIQAGVTLNEVSTQIINDASYGTVNAGAEAIITKKTKSETPKEE